MKIFLLLFTLLAMSASLFAQGEDLLPPPLEYQVTQETRINGQVAAEPPSYYESMDTLYKLLSPARMQTSFLIDRAMPIMKYHRYNGTLTDSNYTTGGDALMLYFGVQAAWVDTLGLMPLPPDTTWFPDSLSPADTIPFVIMGAKYDYIKSYAVDSGLIELDTVAGAFRDIEPEPAESPYGQDWVFAAAPVLTGTDTLVSTFIFHDDLTLTSFTRPDTMFVNFGDGMGERAITPNSVVSVTWPDTGSYTIVTRIVKPGGGVNTASSFTGCIFEATRPPKDQARYGTSQTTKHETKFHLIVWGHSNLPVSGAVRRAIGPA